jgi:hypothetical protein
LQTRASSFLRNCLGFTNVTFPLLIAVVITIIADLDRPRRGMIGTSQQALIDLKRRLGAIG